MKNIFKKIIAVATFIIATQTTFAQNNVGIGTNSPNASAVLDVTATDKGMLVPRMTNAQRDAIATPATGLLVYQTDNTPGFYNYNGSAWVSVTGASLPSQTGNSGKVLTTDGTNLSWGSGVGASYELHVTKTTAEAQTTAVGSSLSLPDVITFSNTSADATNAPLGGTSAPFTTPNGKWDGAKGKFTATNPGLYFVDVQFGGDIQGVQCVPMLDWNGKGNDGSSYYGIGNTYTVAAQSPHKVRGTLQRLVWMNKDDYFQVRGMASNSAAGSVPATDGSTYIKIVKLK